MVSTLTLNEALNSLRLPDLDRNLFSSPPWLHVLEDTYGTDIYVKYIKRDGRVDSYIVYSVVKNFLEWKICICSYCDYCDCHVTSLDDWRAFFKSLRQEYPEYRITIRNLRDEIVRTSPDFEVLSTERFHILDIKDSLDDVWKRAHDSYKSAVKQGQKNNITVKECEKSELKKFYELHLKVRKYKYKLFAQPYRFFEIIWKYYMDEGNGVLLGAYDESEKFVAGNIYLFCGNTSYYKFNTSSVQALKLRPNNLLFWEGVKLAKERGCEYVDLGSSGCHQEGLILYKNHTGAVMQDITHLGFAPEGYKFSEKRILRTMTNVFTHPFVPDPLTKFGSNFIYPYLA